MTEQQQLEQDIRAAEEDRRAAFRLLQERERAYFDAEGRTRTETDVIKLIQAQAEEKALAPLMAQARAAHAQVEQRLSDLRRSREAIGFRETELIRIIKDAPAVALELKHKIASADAEIIEATREKQRAERQLREHEATTERAARELTELRGAAPASVAA